MFCFRLNYEGAIIAKKAASDVTEATGLQKFVAGAIGRKHAKRRNLQNGISCAISRNFCYKKFSVTKTPHCAGARTVPALYGCGPHSNLIFQGH